MSGVWKKNRDIHFVVSGSSKMNIWVLFCDIVRGTRRLESDGKNSAIFHALFRPIRYATPGPLSNASLIGEFRSVFSNNIYGSQPLRLTHQSVPLISVIFDHYLRRTHIPPICPHINPLTPVVNSYNRMCLICITDIILFHFTTSKQVIHQDKIWDDHNLYLFL